MNILIKFLISFQISSLENYDSTLIANFHKKGVEGARRVSIGRYLGGKYEELINQNYILILKNAYSFKLKLYRS